MATYALDTTRAWDLAIRTSPHGIVVVDRGGTIMLASRELERQFGYATHELLGAHVESLLPDANSDLHAAHVSGGAIARRQHAARHKNGSTLPIDVEWAPLHTPDGWFALGTIAEPRNSRRRDDSLSVRLDDHFAFERLVIELTFEFSNVPTEQLADATTAGLRRTGELIGLDHCALYRIGRDHVPFAMVSWGKPDTAAADNVPASSERFPWSLERILAGDIVSFETMGDIPSPTDRDSYAAASVKSAVVVPLPVKGCIAGAVSFSTTACERAWTAETIDRLRLLAAVFAQVLARRLHQEAMQATASEADRLREQLQVKRVSIRNEGRERNGAGRVVGQSAAIRQVLEKVRQVAAMDSTVLLLGETGTGKELFASQIHELGSRHGRQMVRVNCAAIPTTLIESELFGREKGAFTGSLSRQIGRFEMADRSTLFLDEVGDLPADVQVKLLRVLEERKFERLGSPRSIAVDTRIIAATHRNLEALMAGGAFREDLYYRLSVFPIHVPPLRERVEDIPLLVWRFVEEFSKTFGRRIESIESENLAALQQYSWPGNIRELRNVVERAMIVSTGPRLTIPPPHASATAVKRSPKLIDVEKEHIRSVVESTGWRIRGVGGAAERLGMRPTTLETRMAKLGLRRPHPA